MTRSEHIPSLRESPTIEQLEEYIGLMRDVVHANGRGVRNFVRYEESNGKIIPRFAGKEFFLPGAHTEWSTDSATGHVVIERERRISALYRPLGLSSAKLGILESDSVRYRRELPPEDGDRSDSADLTPRFYDTYQTLRKLYRLEWDSVVGIFTAEKREFEIISDADVDAEVLPRPEFDAPDRMVFEHERGHGGIRYEEGWQPVLREDFDRLRYRTDQYREAILAEQPSFGEPE